LKTNLLPWSDKIKWDLIYSKWVGFGLSTADSHGRKEKLFFPEDFCLGDDVVLVEVNYACGDKPHAEAY